LLFYYYELIIVVTWLLVSVCHLELFVDGVETEWINQHFNDQWPIWLWHL